MLYFVRKEILTVRDVDGDAWRKFRARTSEEGLKAGEALTQAMRLWIKERETGEKPNPKNLLRIKPVKVGTKKVRWSEEIDQTLYG